MQSQYISTVEQAKLIRVQLKKHFPGIKFQVKSHKYAGGSSINIHWNNGPTQPEVDAIVEPFSGGGFDGMIDMAYSKESWLLPDGSVTYAKSPGTVGSRGMVGGYDHAAPVDGAKLVSFSANYIFTNRHLTAGAMLSIAEEVKERYGSEIPELVDVEFGHPYFKLAGHEFDHHFHEVAKSFSL